MGRGTHTSEETQGRPVLHPEDLWRHPPPSQPTTLYPCPWSPAPSGQAPASASPTQPKQDHLSSQSLFILRSFFL